MSYRTEVDAVMGARHDAARSWLEDVFDDCPADLSDREAYDAINRHYEGGWAQFVRDGE